MFIQRRQMIRGAAIALAFVSSTDVYADRANDDLPGVRAELKSAHHGNDSAARRNDIEAVVDDDRSPAKVIEEIVVIGKKKGRRLNFGRALIDAMIHKPGRFKWRFLPVYDPEEEDRHNGVIQFDYQIGRVGNVEIFRLNFGRK